MGPQLRLFPLQFKRQEAEPPFVDMTFTTTASRVAYLSSPRSYAGMVVSDLEEELVYFLSTDKTEWLQFGMVDDAIVDGVVNRAPSQNAVYDALALKQDNLDDGVGFVKSNMGTITYDGNTYVIANAPIVGATKTKITYDSKGLVTAGTDVTVADVVGLPEDLALKVAKAGDTMTGSLLMTAPARIDSILTGGSDVLNIGTSNADVINIGWSGTTVNIQGTLLYQNVDNLAVEDKLIKINVGGSFASGTGAGFEVEENSVITGYLKTDSTRTGWDIKSPASSQVTLGLDLLTTDRIIKFPNDSGTLLLTSRTLTINGVTYDLSANRSWSVGSVTTVSGTANRISVLTGTTTPVIDIASTYVGQTSITTLGTIGTGAWQGTAVADAYIVSAAIWHAKQPQLNGTGFVKASGTTITYDNSTYYLASNPAGYITGYTETDTFDTVLGRGNTSFNKNLGVENGQVFITKAANNDLSLGSRLQFSDSTSATRGLALHLGNDGDLQLQTFRSGTWSTPFTIANNGGAANFTSSVTAAAGFFNSDIRLKNILDLNLPDTDSLQSKSYKWKLESGKYDGDKIHYGYIAQEVEAYIPEAIIVGVDGYKSVNYAEVHTVKIQRLEEKVRTLESLVIKLGGEL